MEYSKLGKAGVRVSKICLGTAFRAQESEKVCLKVIHRALDLGINFIDSANYYGQGRSETILGKALKDRRDDVVLTTKVWSPVAQGPNDRGLSRFHILREVERSLQRLSTDHIDLYLLHAYDKETPLEETLRSLDDLVRQGKVRYTGCCNFTAVQVVEALWASEVGGIEPISCVQSQYNLLYRWEIEPELLSLCQRHGLGVMTYSPLAIGLLSGRFRRGQKPPEDTPWGKGQYDFDRAMSEQADDAVQTLVDIGGKHGKTPGQVALAWLLDHPEVTAPVIGPDLPEQVDEAVGALGWQLSADERKALDLVSKVEGPRKYT
jgi:aryl-alcohol dehydrogenase-like predicted oxidoreductase